MDQRYFCCPVLIPIFLKRTYMQARMLKYSFANIIFCLDLILQDLYVSFKIKVVVAYHIVIMERITFFLYQGMTTGFPCKSSTFVLVDEIFA